MYLLPPLVWAYFSALYNMNWKNTPLYNNGFRGSNGEGSEGLLQVNEDWKDTHQKRA